MRRLKCSEVWGGITNEDTDACSPGLTVSLYSSSCNGGKGGDVYYFSLCSSDRVARIALADVVGHGEEVGRISRWVYEQMAAQLDESDLPRLMARLNARFVQEELRALTTALVLSYHRDLHRMYYCYAGHPPALRRVQSGRWEALLAPRGGRRQNLPLGVTKGARYLLNDAAVAAGDVFLLYSDGLVEARNRNGVFFGAGGLRATLAELGDADPGELKRGVIGRLHEWAGGGLDHDDVTLMVIQANGHNGMPHG